jgi:hypothetical protein
MWIVLRTLMELDRHSLCANQRATALAGDQSFSSRFENQISPAKMTRQATTTATAPKWLVRFSAIPTSAALMNPPINKRITASAISGTRDL